MPFTRGQLRRRGVQSDPANSSFQHCDRQATMVSAATVMAGPRKLLIEAQRLMADHGVVCSMSRSGNVWDNAAMESFFSSLKTERTANNIYRTRDEARADVFDYIERFYNRPAGTRPSAISARLSSSATGLA